MDSKNNMSTNEVQLNALWTKINQTMGKLIEEQKAARQTGESLKPEGWKLELGSFYFTLKQFDTTQDDAASLKVRKVTKCLNNWRNRFRKLLENAGDQASGGNLSTHDGGSATHAQSSRTDVKARLDSLIDKDLVKGNFSLLDKMLANQKIPSANFLAPMSQLTFADRMAEALLMDPTAINEYSKEDLHQLRVDFAKIKSRTEQWLKSNTSTEQAKEFWVRVYGLSLVGHFRAERILQEAVSLAAFEQASTASSFSDSADSVFSASRRSHHDHTGAEVASRGSDLSVGIQSILQKLDESKTSVREKISEGDVSNPSVKSILSVLEQFKAQPEGYTAESGSSTSGSTNDDILSAVMEGIEGIAKAHQVDFSIAPSSSGT